MGILQCSRRKGNRDVEGWYNSENTDDASSDEKAVAGKKLYEVISCIGAPDIYANCKRLFQASPQVIGF